LEKEHRKYSDRKAMWQRYRDFYVGGEQLRRNAALYLVRRQKEPNDVYSERLARVFYENYVGSCIDWYAAALFRKAPEIRAQSKQSAVRDFYASFVGDCDCRRTPLAELMRRTFIEALVFGESFVLIDFPRVTNEATNRAEEDALGKSRAYLEAYSPLDVTNWSTDARGDFEWAVLKSRREYQESLEQGAEVVEDRWTYFDRENFRAYSRKIREGEGATVELIDEGRHGLAELKRVPLVRLGVSDGLWLANKAALLQGEHFNKSNALSWALHMGLFAMPVIYSEREWQQIVGEAYYIQLGPDDRFGWTEPEGKVFDIAARNLDRLKDEIFRVCYLMTQAGGREARHLGQSGESKRRDFAVTREVLQAYGSLVKEFLTKVLRLTAEARKDEVSIDVSGMDEFEEPNLAEELEAAGRIKELEISSKRLDKEVQKRVALKYLNDASQETKNAVLDEIEAQ
jgi:hypothetical protein